MNLGKIINLLSFAIILIIVLLTTGCSKQNNKLIINNFNSRTPDFSQTQDNITFEAKKLNSQEFSAIFPGSNFKKHIYFKKYNIYKLSIKNDSNYILCINNHSILSNATKNLVRSYNLYNNIKKPEELLFYAICIPSFLAAIPISLIASAYISNIRAVHSSLVGGTTMQSVWNEMGFVLLGTIILAPIIMTIVYFIAKSIYKRHEKNNMYLSNFLENNLLDIYKETIINKNTSIEKYIFIEKKAPTINNLIIKLFKKADIDDEHTEDNYTEFNINIV